MNFNRFPKIKFTKWAWVIAIALILGIITVPNAVGQIQDPSMSGEVTKDTVHVNEDLIPKKRTWKFIPDPWIDPENPNIIKLNPEDKSRENWRKRRDLSAYPKREPGPMNVHRYDVHFENVGIPTFFRRPVAMTPEDLKAGRVDVAIFGAPLGNVMPAGGGQFWGPMMVRATPTGNNQYGSVNAPLSLTEYETLVEPFNVLNVVDYGDVATNPFNMMVTQEELRKVTREVAETGAIPMIIGGDHSVPFGGYRGVADVYGYKKVAMGSWSYGENYYEQARNDGMTIYAMNEIQRDGFKAVMDKILKKLEGKDLVYITLDIDVLDMAYVPGTNSSEPTGLTPQEFLPQLRRLCAAKRIVGVDLVEYNPMMDNKGMQTARMVRHLAIAIMGGIAMNALEMDPEYVHPQVTGELNK